MPREWSDTYVTVNADGSISFDFTGHIHAQGLDLDAGVGVTPPADSKVRWLDVNGIPVAEIESYNFGSDRTAKISAMDSGGNSNTGVQCIWNSAAASSRRVFAFADAFGATIIDGARRSNFFKVNGLADRTIGFGNSLVTFTAADNTPEVSVPHGLNGTPSLVLLSARAPVNARVTIQESTAPNSANIFVRGFQTQGVAITTTQNFYWLAVV